MITTVDADELHKHSWFLRTMRQALKAAQFSPDPSTQNAAIFLTPSGTVSAVNEFPRGVEYTDERWERPLKYSIIEHAERNGIYKAALKGFHTQGGVLVAPWAACADCARGIIQCGAEVLVRLAAPPNERWDDSIKIGDEMLNEANISVIELEHSHFGITLRRNGEEMEF